MYLGGCVCKYVRYRFSGNPITCYACHCTDCQTLSGSAFGLSMIVNDTDVEIIEGEFTIDIIDYNGAKIKKHQCVKCSTSLGFSSDEYKNILALKPGTFDDTSWFKPIAHLWTRSAQSWVMLDKSTSQYEKQPEMSELIRLWKKRENA